MTSWGTAGTGGAPSSGAPPSGPGFQRTRLALLSVAVLCGCVAIPSSWWILETRTHDRYLQVTEEIIRVGPFDPGTFRGGLQDLTTEVWVTGALAVLALASLLAALWLETQALLRRRHPAGARLAAVAAAIGLGLVSVAAATFGWPAGIGGDAQFFVDGSARDAATGDSVSKEFGGGFGWYLALVGFVLVPLVALVLGLVRPRTRAIPVRSPAAQAHPETGAREPGVMENSRTQPELAGPAGVEDAPPAAPVRSPGDRTSRCARWGAAACVLGALFLLAWDFGGTYDVTAVQDRSSYGCDRNGDGVTETCTDTRTSYRTEHVYFYIFYGPVEFASLAPLVLALLVPALLAWPGNPPAARRAQRTALVAAILLAVAAVAFGIVGSFSIEWWLDAGFYGAFAGALLGFGLLRAAARSAAEPTFVEAAGAEVAR